MDSSAMQVDTTAVASGKRKRTRATDDDDDEDDEQQPLAVPSQPWESSILTAPKRLRDRQGHAIGRRGSTLKYNTNDLLNTLAYTRLYVTANFHAYNPLSSPVLLVFVSEESDGGLYSGVAQILDSLYGVAPSLQALAFSAQPLGMRWCGIPAAPRTELPIFAVSSLDERFASDLQSFREALPDPQGDMVVVCDASGTCLWTSDEVDAPDQQSRPGLVSSTEWLENALIRVLKPLSPADAMDEG